MRIQRAYLAFISYFSVGPGQDRSSFVGYSLADAENDVMRVPLVNRILDACHFRSTLHLPLPYLTCLSKVYLLCVQPTTIIRHPIHLWQRDFWRFCDSCRWIFAAKIHRRRRWTMPHFKSYTRNREHLIDLRHQILIRTMPFFNFSYLLIYRKSATRLF